MGNPRVAGLEIIWPGLQEVPTPNDCAPIKLGATDADTNESSPKLGGTEQVCQKQSLLGKCGWMGEAEAEHPER